VANLLSSQNVASDQIINDVRQRTLKGDINGVISYLTGTTPSASTQDVFRNLSDSIDRQGKISEQLREGEMNYLRGLKPTQLEQARADALEKVGQNSYTNFSQKSPSAGSGGAGVRLQDPKTGEIRSFQGLSPDELQDAIKKGYRQL
jgi:hypothetical protein